MLEEINRLQKQLDVLRVRVAKSSRREQIPEGSLEILLCVVGRETIGLLLNDIDEVVMFCELTTIPESPFWVLGLLSLRGELVPVVDILSKTTGQPRTPQINDYIVICSLSDRKVGLVVQDVLDLIRGDFEIKNPQADETPLSPYMLGAIQHRNKPAYLFSIQAFLESYENSGAVQ